MNIVNMEVYSLKLHLSNTFSPFFSLPGPGDCLLLSAWDGGLVQPAGASAEVSVTNTLLPVFTRAQLCNQTCVQGFGSYCTRVYEPKPVFRKLLYCEKKIPLIRSDDSVCLNHQSVKQPLVCELKSTNKVPPK